MGMKWIKQIFGIKPDEDWPQGTGALDVLAEKHEFFKDATKTNELVISGNIHNSSELKTYTKNSLIKKTKLELEELARSEFGLELDRRKKKDELVAEIIKAQ